MAVLLLQQAFSSGVNKSPMNKVEISKEFVKTFADEGKYYWWHAF